MALDLNGAWTDADVAALLASVVDDRDWQIEVSKAGIAELQDKTSVPTGIDHDATLHGDFEAWTQGTDFTLPGGPPRRAWSPSWRRPCATTTRP